MRVNINDTKRSKSADEVFFFSLAAFHSISFCIVVSFNFFFSSNHSISQLTGRYFQMYGYRIKIFCSWMSFEFRWMINASIRIGSTPSRYNQTTAFGLQTFLHWRAMRWEERVKDTCFKTLCRVCIQQLYKFS